MGGIVTTDASIGTNTDGSNGGGKVGNLIITSFHLKSPMSIATASNRTVSQHKNTGSRKTDGHEQLSHQPLKEGDRVPSTIIKALHHLQPGKDGKDFSWKDLTSDDLFKGKRVVVFGLPGAFTPVCTCDHLPSYLNHYQEILSCGIDDIYGISVNDAHVMRHWGIMNGLTEDFTEEGKAQSPLNPGNFKPIKLIADGTAAFTKAMGMAVYWEKVSGFGIRSWRYSAVFNDMKIEKLFIEENGIIVDDADAGPEPFLVSGGEMMVEYLKENAAAALAKDKDSVKTANPSSSSDRTANNNSNTVTTTVANAAAPPTIITRVNTMGFIATIKSQ